MRGTAFRHAGTVTGRRGLRTTARAVGAGLVVSLAPAAPAGAATAGDRDPQFGTAGTVRVDVGLDSSAQDVLVQPDGRIVVVGSSGGDAAIARLLPDGTPDPTFSADGRRTVDLGGPDDVFHAVTRTTGGQLVAVGGTGTRSVVVRLTKSGTLDTSFSGDGRASEPAGGGSANRTGYDVVAEPGGRVAVVGEFRVARWSATGTQSAPGGTPWFDGGEGFRRIGRLSGGDYVVAGASDCNSAVVDRYDRSGALNPGFSANAAPFVGVRAVGLSVLAGDKVLVVSDGWQATDCERSPGLVLERYHPDGRHDSTFSGDGARVFDTSGWPAGARNEPATGAAVAPDGRIVVVGRTWVARFTAGGALDTAFSGDGIALLGGPTGAGVAVQADGNPVAAATTGGDLAAIRLLGSRTVTAYPASVVDPAKQGRVTAGGPQHLTSRDAWYLTARSSTSGTRTAAWYGRFTDVPNGATSLSISYSGKASRTVKQSLALWDFDAGRWVAIDRRSVGTTRVTVTDTAGGRLARFVSGTSGTGTVRLRVRATAAASFTLSGDRMALSYR